LNYPRCR